MSPAPSPAARRITAGAWCLGNAWLVWVVHRHWPRGTSVAVLVYLWTFSVLETVVLVWFRDRLTAASRRALSGPTS